MRATWREAALLLAAAAPVSAAEPVWRGALPRLPDAGEEVVIVTPAGRVLRAVLRPPEAGAAQPEPLPIDAPLLAAAQLRAFGAEERCRVARRGDGLVVDCAAGVRPAGAVVGFDGRPLPGGARLRLAVRAAAAGGFGAAVVPPGRDAEAPQALAAGAALFDLGQGSPLELVLVAPPAGGRLVIDAVSLVPAVAAAAAPGAAWAWSPAAWRGDAGARLIAAARSRRLDRLFVGLDVARGRVGHAAALQRFVRAAAAAGIAVEAVEGDPAMAGDGLAAALARARAIAAYQRSAPVAARLAGVQYDIEPYVEPGWRGDAAAYRAWADAVRALAAELGEPVDLVLPFWLADMPEGRAMLDRVAPALRMVTVMAYRRDPDGIERAAAPLLGWGTAAGKPVRVALEAERLADETEVRYAPAPRGTLAVHPGPPLRAELFATERRVAGARMYARRGETLVRAAALSFLGDEAAMRAAAETLRPTFAAWPSFAGYAFHGLRF